MDLLDSFLNPYNALAARGQAFPEPRLICIHPNCPICAEKETRKAYEQEKRIAHEAMEKKIKKAKYDKRCEEYIKNFRKIKA